MNRAKVIGSLVIILTVMISDNANSLKERQLGWEDLIPVAVQFDDPFENLDREQMEYLGFVARIRNMMSSGEKVSQGTRAELLETEQYLKGQGVDIDDLLSRREEVQELRRKRASQVVAELDGASIKIPGYLLPLEYSGTGVTEFLLVPWVGACIHTPPPPPNQIVYVTLGEDSTFKSASMFEPVWVSGLMATESGTKNLFLKDGSGDIHMGYKMLASEVVRYR